MKMRSIGLSALSVLLTGVVIGNAYYQKKQFYPSVVYITKSNPSMAVIYIQFFVIVLMLGKLLRKIFLGTLRAAEFEHLMERFWYALTETCLAFTVFRDDFNPRFVALFTVLLFLKSFHWLAEERVDYMERSPMISWLFHIRVASLLTVLGTLDYLMFMHAYNSTIAKGPTVQLVFGFEYAILITMVANTTIKYVLHGAEMRAETPWENKAVFLLYTELIIGLIKVILYVLFVVIMAKIYALPMFVFRPMFYTMRNFKKALNDVIMSRRAIRNMNTLYPDATTEELEQSDNICIICREDMVSNSKKLPCGHIFHTACLRSWFQRQQTCPTCRLNILRTPHQNNSTQLPRQDAVNAAQIPNAAGANGNPAAPAGTGAVGGAAAAGGGNQPQFPPGFNINNIQNQLPFGNFYAAGNLPNFTTTGLGGINLSGVSSGTTTIPPFVLPPFPFMTPFAIPPPPMPQNLTSLTDEELSNLEGNERRHVEERIKLLRNIQLLLDASVVLMNQYTTITANLPPPSIIIPTVAAASAQQHQQSEPTPSTSQDPPQSTTPTTTINNTDNSSLDKAKSPDNTSTNSFDNIQMTNNNNMVSTSLSAAAPAATTNVKIEDIGSEEHVDGVIINKNPLPSTSKEFIKDITTTTTDNIEEDNTELNELRRRRLQKFNNNECNENNTTID